ncbi:MAG: hypothetical protein GX927_05445 [Lentisphaerae bacterium]|nr:hypothetical protein [Lentisphaerota bacterium]
MIKQALRKEYSNRIKQYFKRFPSCLLIHPLALGSPNDFCLESLDNASANG